MNNSNGGKNKTSLRTLLRIIEQFSNEFSLVFVCCNYRSLQEKVVKIVRNKCSVPPKEITLDCETKTLYRSIKQSLGESQPHVRQ